MLLEPLRIAYALPSALAALAVMLAGGLVWLRHRSSTGATMFILFSVTGAIWSLAYALEMLVTGLEVKVLLGRIQYVGIASVPVLWLLFVLQYAGLDRWVTRGRLLALSVIPLVTLALVWTSDWHTLFWTNIRLETAGVPIPFFRADKGPWFWVHATYGYLILLSGTLLLAWTALRPPALFRRQAITLLAASGVPWIGNILYLARTLTGSDLLPGLDLSSAGFAITGPLLVLGVYRLRLLDVTPAARGVVLDSISEAVIVLNAEDRVTDLNAAAEKVLGRTAREAVGLPATEVFVSGGLLEQALSDAESQVEVEVEKDGETRSFEVRASPLGGPRGRQVGRIMVLHDITAHKRAEQSLRESEERYRTLLEATFEAILVHQRGVILDVNPTFEHMFGYTREEVMGRSVMEFIEPEWRIEVERRIETGSQQPYEIVARRKDGGLASIEVRGKPLTYQQRPVRVAAIRDLTERKRIELAERSQRRLAEALRDTAAALSSTLELDDVLDRILDSARRVLAHESADIMLLENGVARVVRARAYVSGADIETIASLRFRLDEVLNLRQMAETGQPVILPDVQHAPAWAQVPGTGWIRAYAGAPIRADGQTIGFLNLNSATPGFFSAEDGEGLRVFADQAAIAIRNARLYGESRSRSEQLALLNQITRIGTATVQLDDLLQTLADSAAQIVSGDSCFITLWDAENERAIPAAAYGTLRDSYQEIVSQTGARTLTRSAIQEGRSLAVEDLLNSPHIDRRIAEQFPTRAALALPLYAGGRTLGALILGFNKQHTFSEDEIDWAEQAAELIALAIAKAQAYAELEARNRELDAFSHTVAHDVRSPLSIVVGSLELLADEEGARLTDDGRQMLSSARRAALKIDQIIDALLVLAGIRSTELVVEVVDMNPVVQTALERLKPEVEARGLTIEVAPDLPQAVGYGPWLEQVFANLLGNAIKYIGDDNSQPVIRVQGELCARAGRSRDAVRYEVQDNGLGIEAVYHERLFEMFTRFHLRHGQGLGMGLSIVQRIIHRLNGEVGVESAPGSGSTFWFTLPAPPQE